MTANSFGSRATLEAGGATHEIYRLDAVPAARPPVQPEGAAGEPAPQRGRREHHRDHIRALANWDPTAEPDTEIQFTPARVILQDFTGVPAVVDLAAMRQAMQRRRRPERSTRCPGDLVIDHSVQVDSSASQTVRANVALEFQRNRERYQFLRWGQNAFDDFRVVPPAPASYTR